jgi:hypothetical protein
MESSKTVDGDDVNKPGYIRHYLQLLPATDPSKMAAAGVSRTVPDDRLEEKSQTVQNKNFLVTRQRAWQLVGLQFDGDVKWWSPEPRAQHIVHSDILVLSTVLVFLKRLVQEQSTGCGLIHSACDWRSDDRANVRTRDGLLNASHHNGSRLW